MGPPGCPVLQQSPVLAAWAHFLTWLGNAGCQLLELDCRVPSPEEQCATTAWLLSLAATLLLAAAALGSLLTRLLQWLTQRDGARMVMVAAQVLKELRKAAPQEHPPERHLFAPPPPGAAADPLAPLLCGVCLKGIAGGAAAPAASMQCCTSCGTTVHDRCARRASRGCRPLCCAAQRQPHFWQAHGTMLEPEVVEGSSTAVLTCLYCSEPADADALPPAEPLWRCALCAAACHVQCWCDAHPQLPAVATKLRALMNATSGGAGSDGRQARQAQHGEVGRPHPGQPDGPLARPLDSVGSSGSSGSGSSEDGEAGEPVGAATHAEPDGGERGFPATPPPPPRRANGASWLQRLAATVGFRRKGAAAAGGDVAARDESGYCSDSESDDVFDAARQRQQAQRARRRRLLGRDVPRLDECGLGPHHRSVLPPVAVRAALRSGGSSQAELDRLPAATAAATASAAGRKSKGLPQNGAAAPAGTAGSPGASAGGAGGGSAAAAAAAGSGSGRRKKGGWWRSLYGPKRLQWQDYRIGQLPPGCRPVLVFINTKSGPQAGAALRRRFLRALHPLQVVELPRQAPDAALRLFAPAGARARILVVGGDGSVAWILSRLEALREEQAAAGNPHWQPPPVAVLPLGTGNDLARCLGWGGGHGAWQQEGVGSMLAEVQHAAPTHVDRWSVGIMPPPPPVQAPTTRGRLQAALAGDASRLQSVASMVLQRGGGGTGGTAPVVKQMTNYLGVGVDAKIALEFHAMREQAPFFFTSQLGNKLWYTAVGGKDIVAGHACADLASKLRVTCDGRPVALPPGTEGLLVLNISSYMGGVDLWRNGYSYSERGGRNGGGGANGGAPQSMMDGRVELVAVFGSFHLGQLQVGLSRAVRLDQGRDVTLASFCALPMQVDGEPWVQSAAVVAVARSGQALLLRRVRSKPLARMMQAVSEVLEEGEQRGTITAAQHRALMGELSARLQPLLLHPA